MPLYHPVDDDEEEKKQVFWNAMMYSLPLTNKEADAVLKNPKFILTMVTIVLILLYISTLK